MFTALFKNDSLQAVNYSRFQNILNQNSARKIRQKGKTTYIYDRRNRVLAKLQLASMDAFGRIEPAQYFVRSA